MIGSLDIFKQTKYIYIYIYTSAGHNTVQYYIILHTVLWWLLSPQQLKIHRYAVSIVATDALMLKHQAISNHSADKVFIVFDQFHTKTLHLMWTTSENCITFWKISPRYLRVKLDHTSSIICCAIYSLSDDPVKAPLYVLTVYET